MNAKFVKRVGPLVGISAVAVVFASVALAQTDPIDAYVRNEMAKRHIPGLAFAIIKNNRVVKARNYGLANIEQNSHVSDRTTFEIASMTKQFTAAAMLLLVQDGKVDLDASVGKYVSGVPDSWRGITVRRLLNHTSGLRDDWDEDDDFFLTHKSDDEFLKALVDRPLKFGPGERFSYSCGPFVAGMVIAKVSGMPYAAFMKERIFDRLGMSSTRINDPSAIVSGRAAGYVYRGGTLKNGVRISPAAEARGDVGISTTVLDMAKWDAALNGTKFLKASSLKEMFGSAQLNDGSTAPYGLGWFTAPARGHRAEWHSGGFRTGFSSSIDRYPDDHLTVIVLGNLQQGHVWSIGRELAGFYIPEFRSLAAATPQPDLAPQQTERFKKLVISIADAKIDLAQTAAGFPSGFYDPEDVRSGIEAMKAFTFVSCRKAGNRPRLFGERLSEICFYKIRTNEDQLISFWLTTDGKVIYIDPYEY
ncbi:MAG TPA: serine hydrolase domain-containing protein [Pyrinomonadaceae bacterium]|nr:serine hydrolase domain-containing protein [Pyrinomonadaceae bacterium]